MRIRPPANRFAKRSLAAAAGLLLLLLLLSPLLGENGLPVYLRLVGERKELHVIEQDACIKCGICYETCKFDAIDKG